MPANGTLSTKAKLPHTENYGLGFILGLLAGLGVYFFYGTAKGNRLRELAKTDNSLTSDQLRLKISKLRAFLAPYLKNSLPEKTSASPSKASSKPLRRYFKGKSK